MSSTGAVIKVVGVGGGGSNAINRMIEAGIKGVEFIAMNTDVQVLDRSSADRKVQLGANLTKGLGAGGDPEVGRSSAEESKNDVRKLLEGADMVFITAGMGGGTGTGAAPVIADVARELGALTVAIVTRPFGFEGPKRSRLAGDGVTSLIGRVDTMITIPNDRLMEVAERKTTLIDAFRIADDILRQGVQGISDIITVPGQINVDFADVKAIMASAGPALMGIGYGVGEQRALQAAQTATSSRLLEQTIHGARGLLVNITSGEDLTLSEVSDAMEYIHALSDDEEANIFFGTVVDATLEGEVRITVLATGFEESPHAAPRATTFTATQSVAKNEPAPEATADSDQAKVRTTPRIVPKPRENPVKDVWDRAAAQQREAVSEPEDLYDDDEIDVPAFLRAHRKQKPDGS